MNESTGTTEDEPQPAEQPTRLAKTSDEDEAGHLRRVAEELGGANSVALARLKQRLGSSNRADQMAAAARMGAMGDRHAVAELRRLLESKAPELWEVAVHGLRHSRDRAGWLCLESVALANLDSLIDDSGGPPMHAFRLLVMGRTKTMDRLFRATDGHSRSIPVAAAVNFANVAARSVPPDMSRVMAMRLGLSGSGSSTPEAVAEACGLSIEEVRRLESAAWETVQRPRTFAEIMKHYGENID